MRKVAIYLLLIAVSFGLDAKLSKVDSQLSEDLLESCIVDSQQIKIPGYPSALNPSLVPYEDGYLLSFRYKGKFPETEKNIARIDFSFIGVAKLTKNLQVCPETVHLLNLTSYSSKYSLTSEDARLLKVGDRIFIIFNDLSPALASGGTSMYLGELVLDRGRFALKGPAQLLTYPLINHIEKNWSPFVYADQLYLIYSHSPQFVVLGVDLNTGYCQEVTRATVDWNWNWGDIKGGTPAYPLDDMMLTFFHSTFFSDSTKKRVYITGAYLFDKEPPFQVRAMIRAPLGQLADYTEQNRNKIVFPGGMVIQNESILVAWGKADKQVHITTYDGAKLMALMEPIE